MAQIGITGRNIKVAFAKYGTNSWNVAASVTKGVYFESDGGWARAPGNVVDDAFNQVFRAPGDPGLLEAPNVTIPGSDRYADYQYILEACAMGSPAAVTISTSASGQVTSWKHQIDLADTIDGLGVTVAMDKGLYVEELTSARVYGFEFTQQDNGKVQKSFRFMGNVLTNQSTTNTNSTLANATYPSTTPRVVQQQGTFRMNLNSAGSLGASDAVFVQGMTFTFTREQDAPHVYGTDGVSEPADQGFPVVTLECTYPRMNTIAANSLFTALSSFTAMKADLTFTGPLINSTDAYKVLYEFPYLQCIEFKANTAGANQVKPTAKFEARLAPTSPSGMAFVRPFRLTRTTTQSVVAF